MCIGAHLARMETKLALEGLFQRFPNMKLLDDEPKWGKNFIFRGFEHLQIKIN